MLIKFNPFLGLLLCFTVSCYGQSEEVDYDKWISLLSVKEDLQAANFLTVLKEFNEVDLLKRCKVLETLKLKAGHKNKRLTIRLILLDDHDPNGCTTFESAIETLEKALTIAYEIEDDLLAYQVYFRLTAFYIQVSKYGPSVMYGLLAKDLYDKWGREKIFPMRSALHHLVFGLYQAREYESAIDIAWLFLDPERTYVDETDTVPELYEMFTWNTLGLAYSKIGKVDSAFIAFDNALKIARLKNLPFWIGLITGNKGDILYKQGKTDSAEILLRFDYEASIAAKEFDNAANSLQWLARIDLIRHKPVDALRKAREAQKLLNTSYKADYMVNTLLTFTKTFIRLGETDSVNLYLDRFLHLHDSLEQKASDSRAENIMMRLDGQQNINTITLLNKEKRKIGLIRNFIIVCILFLALIGFMILNRQKLQLKLRRKEAMEAKSHAEQEAHLAREQLTQFTRNLIEKTSMLETLQSKLMEREMKEEQKSYISELSSHAILTEEDWDKFKNLFEKVYPGFFYELKNKVPDLTSADQRIAALSKLQLSNKEAATLLGIAPNSVIKARQRLRHRFGLEPEADLSEYFAHSKGH
jgi:tetratricopeptide (TPR) repeat protein